jgi:hypothetical protein
MNVDESTQEFEEGYALQVPITFEMRRSCTSPEEFDSPARVILFRQYLTKDQIAAALYQF